MTTVYYVHHSLKENGEDKFNSVTQSFPQEPDLEMLSTKDYGASFAKIWPRDFTVKPLSKRKKIGDLLLVNPFLIISEKAYFSLNEILKENGEFLSVFCREINGLKAYNPIKCLDVLNKSKCEFSFLGKGELKRPTKVLSYDFMEERITAPIFRIKEDPGLFVTDEFVELVRQSNLKGFGFRRLWNSKEGRVHSRISLTGDGFLPEEEDYNW